MNDRVCPSDGISPEAIPLVCEGVNIMESDISMDEGFLLSRLDGRLNVDLVCSSSGLGRDKTMKLLESLYRKGIVMFHLHGEEHAPTIGGSEGAREEQEEPAEEKTEEQAEEQAREPAEGPAREQALPPDVVELRKALRKTLPRGDELSVLIETIFVNLEHLSYYDILGIARSAEGKAVKKAYLLRSKSFHPDKFYRKADREFTVKLQELFKQVNKGYKTLSDAEARAEYDKSLSQEEIEPEVEEEVQHVGRTRAVKGAPSPWKQIRVSKQKPIEEVVRKKEKEEEKKPSGPKLKLGLGEGRSSHLIRQIQKKIKEKETDRGGPLEKAEKFYKGAMVERHRGNTQGARVNLKLAVQYDPNNKTYAQALEELDRSEDTKKAEQAFREGREAQESGALSLAFTHYKEALKLGYENPKLYHRLADVVMELEGNYERARALCLKALELQPDVAGVHMTLARAYKGLGQKAAAVVQLEKVVKLEPKNKLAAKELKALKRG